MTPTEARRLASTDVPTLLARRARQEPDAVALVVEGAGSLTFGDWHQRSTALARGLLNRGVRRGDRVALVFGNDDWVSFAVAYCATQRAGAVAVPLSDRLAPPEIRRILEHCQASGVLCGRGVHPPSTDAWVAQPHDIAQPHDLGAAGDNPHATPDDPVDVRLDPGDLAQILYTSGTTGQPKGVSASHANLSFGAATNPRRRPFAHSRHFAHAFPIGTNAGQTMLLHALNARPAALTLPRFTPARFAKLVESWSAGTVFLVPTMAIELLNARVHERFDLSSVLLLGSAAAALPPPVATTLADVFPNATIVNYYTSTEAAPAQTSMLVSKSRPGSVGRPASRGDVRIAAEDGQPLPPGETGEVWLRVPAAPRAYYGDQELTGKVFRGRWVRMGDLGYLDDDGYLYLVDRDGDLISTGAYKVSTLHVESALHEHPAVAEAAVVGIPHDALGMRVAAAVVPRSDVSPAVSPTDLREFLAGRLAPHEVPGRVRLLESLPRNHTGKVLKRDLRGLLTDDREHDRE